MKSIVQFIKAESGATTVEYAIMLALIAAVCIAAIIATGGEAGGFWGENAESIDQAFNK